ncbi:Hpt domain-containing protein [Andreprevotia lacus DSM 23236]|jgi:HPt (histidine-containing phosphotransfer) domain-containing protein|uniref:Hpt domain-containing protein n=1 Tax=Andreprevotia lacus DSM 23236 TaxID=1121001 RepID=A0A1W1XYG8_9NEIS|nr:Hpt domain-containing protein [Andreprevotia lacus]SMC28904.1 Hpt domain-containing protein [Andreprevotia lacus DSM 23236]
MFDPREELASIEATFVQLQQLLGMDMRGELLEAYFVTQDECLKRLAQALYAANSNEAVEAAHKLKGAAAQLGAAHMSVLCSQVEQHARAGRLDEVRRQWPPMSELAGQLGQALKR